MAKTKKIWKTLYAQRYAPNSVRYETDDDIAYYCIYINDELYEMCPLQCTKQEAEMRLQEIMDTLGIEWDTEPTWQPITILNNNED